MECCLERKHLNIQKARGWGSPRLRSPVSGEGCFLSDGCLLTSPHVVEGVRELSGISSVRH